MALHTCASFQVAYFISNSTRRSFTGFAFLRSLWGINSVHGSVLFLAFHTPQHGIQRGYRVDCWIREDKAELQKYGHRPGYHEWGFLAIHVNWSLTDRPVLYDSQHRRISDSISKLADGIAIFSCRLYEQSEGATGHDVQWPQWCGSWNECARFKWHFLFLKIACLPPLLFAAADRTDRVSSVPYPPEDDSFSKSHARESVETVSHRTLSNQKSVRHAAPKINKAPLDAHAQALLSFLQAHVGNLRTLQTSLQGPSPAESKPPPNTVGLWLTHFMPKKILLKHMVKFFLASLLLRQWTQKQKTRNSNPSISNLLCLLWLYAFCSFSRLLYNLLTGDYVSRRSPPHW